MLIIDDGAKDEFWARLEPTPSRDRYRVVSQGPDIASVAVVVSQAKRRLAVAVYIDGDLAWSQAFAVDGSKAALDPLIDGCKLATSSVVPSAPK